MWTLNARLSWTWDTCLELSIRLGPRMGDAAASTCSSRTCSCCSLSMFCSWSSTPCVPLITCSFTVLKTATCLTSDGSSATASTNSTEAQGCYLVNSSGKPRCFNTQLICHMQKMHGFDPRKHNFLWKNTISNILWQLLRITVTISTTCRLYKTLQRNLPTPSREEDVVSW